MLEPYGLALVTPPAEEPLSLVEVKSWLRVEHNADDIDISALVVAARGLVEEFLGRQLVSATWRLTAGWFPDFEIRLPKPPLLSIASIQYLDTAGVLQTLDDETYDVDAAADPGVVMPASGYSWPATRTHPQSVRITYQAGYGTAASVPEGIKTAIKLLIANWYQRRGDGEDRGLPMSVELLLLAYWSGRYA